MTNNEYLINLEKRKANKNNLESAIFLQVLGIMLIISSFFWYLDAKNYLNEYFSFFSIALGVLFIILGVIVPSIFNILTNVLKRITNVVFSLVLYVILTVIYFIFVFPTSLIFKAKNKDKYYFKNVNKIEDLDNIKSTFVDFNEEYSNKREGKGKLIIILKIFDYFFYKKQYILLPLLVLFLVTGLFIFFMTSSIVAPFIYTLF